MPYPSTVYIPFITPRISIDNVELPMPKANDSRRNTDLLRYGEHMKVGDGGQAGCDPRYYQEFMCCTLLGSAICGIFSWKEKRKGGRERGNERGQEINSFIWTKLQKLE